MSLPTLSFCLLCLVIRILSELESWLREGGALRLDLNTEEMHEQVSEGPRSAQGSDSLPISQMGK